MRRAVARSASPIAVREVCRRRFLGVAAGSLLAAKTALATGCSWSPFASEAGPSFGATFFSQDFTGKGHGWSREWLNVRYEGFWERAGHRLQGEGHGPHDRASRDLLRASSGTELCELAVIGPVRPRGNPGAVHGWLEGWGRRRPTTGARW